jgi:signal transduction histidine kinase
MPLPAEISGEAEVSVLCSGRVARAAEAVQSSDRTSVAVFFDEFRLVNGEGGHEFASAAGKDNKLQGRADALHQLNNQLTISIAYCDFLLERGGIDETARRGLERIRESARRIGKLIDSL